ncbi:hypothetical protein M8J75_005939 [Diaphorina citri]|nr:hypothetical protein M8J75_005939 [Diaphorina citri]KAI5728336.1 hypothetical protein M8J77_014831 [Diaphorina citri]
MNCYAYMPTPLYAFEFVLRKDAVQFFNSTAVTTFNNSSNFQTTLLTSLRTFPAKVFYLNQEVRLPSEPFFNLASSSGWNEILNRLLYCLTWKAEMLNSQGQGKSVQFWCKIRHPKCYDKSSPDFEPDTEIPKSADTVTVSAPSAAGSTAPAKTVKILKPDPSRDYTTDVNRAYYENMVLLKQVVFESEIYDQATFEKKFGLKFLPYAPNTAT